MAGFDLVFAALAVLTSIPGATLALVVGVLVLLERVGTALVPLLDVAGTLPPLLERLDLCGEVLEDEELEREGVVVNCLLSFTRATMTKYLKT